MTGNGSNRKGGRTFERVVLWFTGRRFKALVVSACALAGPCTFSSRAVAQNPLVDERAFAATSQHADVLVWRATNAAEAASSPSAEEVQRIEAIALALFAESEMTALAPRVVWLIAARS
jgi:hypothetical protein